MPDTYCILTLHSLKPRFIVYSSIIAIDIVYINIFWKIKRKYKPTFCKDYKHSELQIHKGIFTMMSISEMSAHVTITDYYLCLLYVHDKITTQKLVKSFIKIYSKIYNQIHVTTKILPFWQLVEFKWKFQTTVHVLAWLHTKNYNYIYMYSYEQMKSCVQSTRASSLIQETISFFFKFSPQSKI